MKVVEKLKASLIHLPELLVIYFSPAAGQILWVLLAIFTDTATGIWAARKANETISSKRLKDVVPKMIVYVSIILLCYMTDKVFDLNAKFGMSAMSVVSLALAGIEIKSIDENFHKATGKGIFSRLLNVMKRK